MPASQGESLGSFIPNCFQPAERMAVGIEHIRHFRVTKRFRQPCFKLSQCLLDRIGMVDRSADDITRRRIRKASDLLREISGPQTPAVDDLSLCRLERLGEEPEERALAAAALPDHDDPIVLPDLEGQAGGDVVATMRERQMGRLDQECHRGVLPLRRSATESGANGLERNHAARMNYVLLVPLRHCESGIPSATIACSSSSTGRDRFCHRWSGSGEGIDSSNKRVYASLG